MAKLFISDIHLQSQRPELTALAVSLFNQAAEYCDHLYILGDMFEYWIGDDGADESADQASKALLALTQSGVPVTLMHGNRDFLVGEAFAKRCGAILVTDDILELDLAGVKTLLLHGDTLCSDDNDYQMYRRMVRNNQWQREFLEKPLTDRINTALSIRNTSAAKGRGQQSISDVTAHTVETLFNTSGAQRLIHGHTHRPAIHQLANNSKQRVVLGDWRRTSATVAIIEEANCQLLNWNGATMATIS